ncbi:MAG: hypothetical protein HQL16_07530 [Candidatus Omnitrophica bacterium]|nr:hypothetical protein [Candidatus Omnitrophota bacterium]
MKSFFIKVFMMVASALCMLEGLVLVAVGLGRLPSDRLLSLYNGLMAAPRSLTTISAVGAFFVTLGFILLVLSSRTKPAPHVIDVEKDGKPLSIPEKAVRSFILQIIEQNPCASDVSVEFEHKGNKDVEIMIAIGLDGVSSIYEELNDIESVLKTELDRVFEWKGFKITFHLRGVGVDKNKKYFSSAVVEPSVPPAEEKVEPLLEAEKPAAGDEAIKAEMTDEPSSSGTVDQDVEPHAEEPLQKRKAKDREQHPSLFSKVLFGEHNAR